MAVLALIVVVAATVLPGREGTVVELGNAPKETAAATPAAANDAGVQPLAKMDGWSPSASAAFEPTEPAFAVVEIAYDMKTAKQAWDATVPDDLPSRTGYPTDAGIYGSFDSVDFSRQAVVVWSSGQSGSCPGWLRDIATDSATVTITRGQVGQVCNADYDPYSMLLAVDRERLPTSSELPTDDVVIDERTTGMGSLVDVYPTSGWPEGGPTDAPDGSATETGSPAGGDSPAVRTLAKMDQWSPGFATAFGNEFPYAALEIAYDRPTAQRAWDDLAVDRLAARTGKPLKEGMYAPLESVDFATEAVVVWSSGQSGSCPGWVANITTEGGRTAVTTMDTSDGPHAKGTVTFCTSDYRSYSMVLAVDRDRLPPASELPTDAVTVNGRSGGRGSVAGIYPASGWPEGQPSEG
jgi:hypothetical protein